jgi:hypothetical protein
MNDKPMSAFGSAPIKIEGGISNPDEFSFACVCEKCQEKYHKWKAEYEAQQKQLRGEA